MKFLKGYKLFENINSMTDEELEERLHWLRVEYKEIGEEISKIVGIQRNRKESSEEELTKDWSDSIWSLDKFQLSWVLEHGHHTTPKHHEISHKYLRSLRGVIDSGFLADTNQYKFSICTNHWMNDSEKDYQENGLAMRSVKLLIDNLKKTTWFDDSVTRFDVLFNNGGYDTSLLYYDENKIVVANGRYNRTEYKSLEDAIKYLVEYDITYDD